MVRRRATLLAVNGWIFLVVAVYLTVDPYAKPYYLLAAATGGFAVGGVVLENLVRHGRTWLRRGVPAAVVLLQLGFGLVMAPVAAPVLSQEATARYLQRLGVVPGSGERARVGVLPQHLADLNGWRDMASNVAAVYHALPADERARTGVYGSNYGRAGAVDVLGRELGLPPALSGHNSYWYWGLEYPAVDNLILVGGEREDYAGLFDKLELARVHTHPWAKPDEARVNIFVGRGMRRPLADIWDRAKNFI
jgi:hypothetical protein